MFIKTKRFGEIALGKGLIAEWQLKQALAQQENARSAGQLQKRIGTILLEKCFLEMDDINGVLEEQKKSAFRSWIGSFFSLKSGT